MLPMWMAYALIVSALLGVAALACERVLGVFGRPVRWLWMGAIAGSVVVPLAAFFAPGALTPVTGPVSAALPELASGIWSAGPGSGAASPGHVAPGLGSLLGWAWVIGAVLFATYMAAGYAELRREMRTWRPHRLLDAHVLVSERRGPAVVGFLRSAIVIPDWMLELDETLLRAVFVHEREHLRAGDHRLFGLGTVLLLLTPWNPVTWWQVMRLRLAIEFDCDRRVLDGGVAKRDYANALMAVGARAPDGWLPTAAFADGKTGVERRLRRLMEPVHEFRTRRTISASGLAALAIILVLGAPPPTDAPTPGAVPTGSGLPEDASRWLPPPRARAGSADRPSFLAYDRPPELTNRSEVMARLNRLYPGELRERGVEGRVELWLYVDERGRVDRFVTKTSSGNDRLDEAAGEVAAAMEFRPAVNRDRPTPVWVSQWLTFTSDASARTPR